MKPRPIDPLETLKQFVATYRTQHAAAEALGISEQYVSDLLLGRRIFSDRILEKLSLARVVVKA